LPDTGDLRTDLLDVAARVAGAVAIPMSQAMLPLIAASTDVRLNRAAADYWGSLFDHPIYLRTLVTHQPVDAAAVERAVDLTVRTLTKAA
jgi:hypothetical protein